MSTEWTTEFTRKQKLQLRLRQFRWTFASKRRRKNAHVIFRTPEKHIHLEITDGPWADLTVKFGQWIQTTIDDETGHMSIDYTLNVVYNPNDWPIGNPRLQKVLGDILLHNLMSGIQVNA